MPLSVQETGGFIKNLEDVSSHGGYKPKIAPQRKSDPPSTSCAPVMAARRSTVAACSSATTPLLCPLQRLETRRQAWQVAVGKAGGHAKQQR